MSNPIYTYMQYTHKNSNLKIGGDWEHFISVFIELSSLPIILKTIAMNTNDVLKI